MSKERLLAVLDGGDWADASVTHVVVPQDVNVEEEQKKHREWYENEYRGNSKTMKYLSFDEWLIERCGGRAAEETDVEEVWNF